MSETVTYTFVCITWEMFSSLSTLVFGIKWKVTVYHYPLLCRPMYRTKRGKQDTTDWHRTSFDGILSCRVCRHNYHQNILSYFWAVCVVCAVYVVCARIRVVCAVWRHLCRLSRPASGHSSFIGHRLLQISVLRSYVNYGRTAQTTDANGKRTAEQKISTD